MHTISANEDFSTAHNMSECSDDAGTAEYENRFCASACEGRRVQGDTETREENRDKVNGWVGERGEQRETREKRKERITSTGNSNEKDLNETNSKCA